ncbi:B-box zinc finger protein, putative [Eimeria acervulina]|uniref:B-box zinc finger protein, putative n=1 Tax=Eimeria acervulina TaxID=5801 RepID=U6GW34_EIMAC|nr:B-box zinc finger protein, putative [Eimeria acervulina]CDI84390.1 B-box zinc finger protein, putative [Eimeria acervulina]
MEFRRELPLAVGKAPAPKVAEFRAAMTAAGARRSSQEGKKQPQPKQQQKQQQQQQEEEAAHNKRETAAAQGDTGEVEQEQQSAAAAGVICCRCGVDAPDLLLLQCQHLLCLPCAAAQLLLQSQQNPLSPYNCLLCPCCSKETLLSDKATATLVRQQPHAPRHQTRQQASATATAEAAAAAAAAGAAAVAGGLRGPSGGKEEVLLPAAAAAADAAADTEWQFICCTCEKRISVVFCRDCAANFCKDCAVETHAPRGADPSVVARLSQHRFSPLSSRGVCPTLPLSNAARCKLRAIDHYKRLDDCEPFLEVAAAAAASASAGAASGASKTAAARGGLTKQQQQQRQSGRRRSAAESSSIKQQLLEEEISEGDSSRVSLEEVVNTRVPVNAFPRLCSVSSVPCDLHAGEETATREAKGDTCGFRGFH